MSKQRTIGYHLISTLGFRQAVSVETYVMLWSVYAETEGHDPADVEELADAIGRNRATLYRWQASFREAFPNFSTPRDLLDYCKRERTAVINVRQLRAMPWRAS